VRREVVDRIRVYAHCPVCGSDRVTVRTQQSMTCGACGVTLYVNACPAVGAILVDKNERVLLLRRAREPGRGKLAFPGGFVNDDETAEQAVRREVFEEVGVTVAESVPLRFLSTHLNYYPEGNYARDGRTFSVLYRTLDLFFVVELPDLGGGKIDPDEVTEVVVVPFGELVPDELAFDSMRQAWQRFRE
jgi:ADP-ribose pyrophosphatase YjhB (NUDIX family)